jgi:hypothetical protein
LRDFDLEHRAIALIELRAVTLEEVPFFAQQVRTICEKCGTPEEFLSVFQMLVTNRAVLWSVHVGNVAKAHVITSLQIDALGVKRNLIWKIHGHDMREWLDEAIEQMAQRSRAAGAISLVMNTRRAGWLKRLNWQQTYTFERVL